DLSVAETIERLEPFEPGVVGISSTTVGIVASGELAARVKERWPSALTLIGGCHSTALPRETLAEFASFDIAVIGEGEETLIEILARLGSGNADFRDVAGTATRDGDTVGTREPSPPSHRES
ncbi:MAG: cobalamin-dependent protein, partial [Planctomycetota bacterium]